MKYAGIGSRSTPDYAMAMLTRIALRMSELDWTLRSGGADGADSAFELGAMKREIYLPWNGFNGRIDKIGDCNWEGAKHYVTEFHPNPKALSRGAMLLMQRNTFQILGPQLDDPVDLVICWADGSKFDEELNVCDVAGGTGQAVRIAYARGIPILNIAISSHLEQWSHLYG